MMTKSSFGKQYILPIAVYTIVFSLMAYLWREIGIEESNISIAVRSFIGASIAMFIIRWVNRKTKESSK